MSTTYIGQAAADRLAAAQAVIDRHLVSCDACGSNRPCSERFEADKVFAGYGRLPRRTPGLTGPMLAGARFRWFVTS